MSVKAGIGALPYRFATCRADYDAHLLEDDFAWKEERTLTKNLAGQYERCCSSSSRTTRSLASQHVEIIDHPDGRIAIRHNARDLPYRTFDKLQKVNEAAIVGNKRTNDLGEVLTC